MLDRNFWSEFSPWYNLSIYCSQCCPIRIKNKKHFPPLTITLVTCLLAKRNHTLHTHTCMCTPSTSTMVHKSTTHNNVHGASSTTLQTQYQYRLLNEDFQGGVLSYYSCSKEYGISIPTIIIHGRPQAYMLSTTNNQVGGLPRRS